MQTPTARFGTVAVLLHWITAACVVVAVAAGLIASTTDDADLTRQSLGVHQSIGITLCILVIGRLLWRLTHAPLPLPETTSRSQKLAAVATHGLLYLTLLALPVTGYIGLAARGRPITIFGLVEIPRLVPRGMELSAFAQSLHENGQYVLYGLLICHIGAALYHHFVLKDGILSGMWPAGRR